MTGVLDVPDVDYAAAHSAALRARQAGTAAGSCLEDLAAALAPGWAGVASQAYLDGRAVVSREATALTQACQAMSRGILDFAGEAAAVLPGWRRDATRLAELERGASDPAVLGVDPDLVAVQASLAERDRLRQAVAVWERRYGEAGLLLAGACARAVALVDDGVLSTADQLWAIPKTLMDQLVVAPLQLGALLMRDPTQADDVALAQWYALKDQMRNPARTADEMSGAPQYRDGAWGEGTGTLVTSAIGFFGLRRTLLPDGSTTTVMQRQPEWRAGRRVRPPNSFGTYRDLTTEEAVRFQRNVRDPDAPRPRPQTLDEMRAGVDLIRSEHPDLGHTVSRHVDVDMDYLLFRLQQGTPTDDGRVAEPPSEASAWIDQATAEATVTRALRDAPEVGQLETLVRSGQNGRVALTMPVGDVGVVAIRGPSGVVRLDDATSVRVVVEQRNGELFILTAFLR